MMPREFTVLLLFAGSLFASSPTANYCLDLDGKNSGSIVKHLAGLHTLNGLSEYTFEAWVRPRTQGGGGRGRILDQEGSSLTFYLSDEGRIGFRANRESSWQLSEANSISFWKWQHIAVTSDAKLLRFFVNGKLVTAVPVNTTLNITRKPVHIGNGVGDDSTLRGFDGWLDNIRVSDICRWTSDFTPFPREAFEKPTSNTVLYFTFDEGPGNRIALDYSTYNAEILIETPLKRTKSPK